MKPLPEDNLNLWLSLNLSISFTRRFGRNILNGRLKHFERGLKINTAAVQRTKGNRRARKTSFGESHSVEILETRCQQLLLGGVYLGDFCGAHVFKSILGKTEDKTHCAVFTQDKMSLLPVVSLPNVGYWIYLLYRCQKKGKTFLE